MVQWKGLVCFFIPGICLGCVSPSFRNELFQANRDFEMVVISGAQRHGLLVTQLRGNWEALTTRATQVQLWHSGQEHEARDGGAARQQ